MINTKIIAESIMHYGEQTELTVCMEECAELTQAISKALRDKGNYDHIVEEMADVYICLEILKQIFDVPDERLENEIRWKQNRELRRIADDTSLEEWKKAFLTSYDVPC